MLKTFSRYLWLSYSIYFTHFKRNWCHQRTSGIKFLHHWYFLLFLLHSLWHWPAAGGAWLVVEGITVVVICRKNLCEVTCTGDWWFFCNCMISFTCFFYYSSLGIASVQLQSYKQKNESHSTGRLHGVEFKVYCVQNLQEIHFLKWFYLNKPSYSVKTQISW